MATAQSYFEQVQVLDYEIATGGQFDPTALMALWDPQGVLTLVGPPPIGTRTFTGAGEISEFYRKRASGTIGKELNEVVWNLDATGASADGALTVRGTRYMVDTNNQGFEVTFQHNFRLNPNGSIKSLVLHVDDPRPTRFAPLGTLSVHDMGRLTSVAWMVA
jgi:hypothetical protein